MINIISELVKNNKRYLGYGLRLAHSTLISSGLIRNTTFVVNNLAITLHDLQRSNILRTIALDGFESYESELVTFIKNYPYHIELFIDGGANIGFYSILTQAYFPSSTAIIAVEPFSENVTYLKEIKSQNGLRFNLVECALDGSDNMSTDLYYPISRDSSQLSSSATLINQFKGTNGVYSTLDYQLEQVKTVSLESLCLDKGPALVKLDIEGNELSVLRASKTLLERKDVDFIIEIMINDEDKEEIFNIMVNHGYCAYLITNAGLVRENRPLTFPFPNRKNRTIWKNHYFTKRDEREIRNISLQLYGYWI